MSVLEFEKIDAITFNDNEVILVIIDHLSWLDESDHLLILQEKVEAYLNFILSNQLDDEMPQVKDKSRVIEVVCKYEITDKGIQFFKLLQDFLDSYAISVRYLVSHI